MLLDDLLVRDDFDVADCTAETLAIEYIVYLDWVATKSVCDQVCVSLLEPGVAKTKTIGYGEFQYSLIFHITGSKTMSTVAITKHRQGREHDRSSHQLV